MGTTYRVKVWTSGSGEPCSSNVLSECEKDAMNVAAQSRTGFIALRGDLYIRASSIDIILVHVVASDDRGASS